MKIGEQRFLPSGEIATLRAIKGSIAWYDYKIGRSWRHAGESKSNWSKYSRV